MARSAKIGAFSVLLALSSIPLIRAAAAPEPTLVTEPPILEVHNASLTSYLVTGATNVQDIRPRVLQRGVNLDGSLRAPPSFPMAIAGNPFEPGFDGEPSSEVNLATGTVSLTDVDLSLPAPGFRWNIARSYNARQETSSPSHRDSNGAQGKNWHQMSQPEIARYSGGGDYDDVIYLVYGADRFVEYAQVNESSTTFKGTNGAAGVMLFAAGAEEEPDTYTLTDQHGTEFTFFGFNAYADPAEGQLWKIKDIAENIAYVGDPTTGSTAIAEGYDGSGRIETAYDTANRRFTYTYSTLDGTVRLVEVEAETKTGGSWASPSGLATVGLVEYSYYTDESYGDAGGLKMVELTIPATDSGVSVVKKRLYRYWEGAYDVSTNPGHAHALKLVVDFEGTRQYDWLDTTFDEDFLSVSHATLEPYSSAYFEYDSSHRIREAYFNGECGCSGGTNGTHNYEYETNGSYSNGGGYDEEWATRTIVVRPNGSYATQQFDEVGQALTRVVTDIDPDSADPVPEKWVWHVVRTSAGLVTDRSSPANVTAYTHSTGAVTTDSDERLVRLDGREGSTVATKGYRKTEKWSEGSAGVDASFEGAWTYSSANVTVGNSAVYRPVVATSRVYPTVTTTEAHGTLTSISTSFRSGTLSPEAETVTLPAVTTGNNGSNSSNERMRYFNEDGTVGFEKAEDGVVTYREYTKGQLTKLIVDADTTLDGVGEDFETVTIPSGLSSSGTPLHRKTTYTYDAQGRLVTTTLPNERVLLNYYSKLADGREVVLNYTDSDGTPKFYGPVQYTVRNHAGKAEVSATIGLTSDETSTALTGHIDETSSDPITAVDIGELVRFSTSIYNKTGGTLDAARLYFDIPGSGAGADGTNYDATVFGYDEMGQRRRVKEAHGTITRSVFDLHGRVVSSWIGTNDNSFAGGEVSGPDNMVKTAALEYDEGNDGGNGNLTERIAYIQDDSTGQRVTTYTHDTRGRVLLAANAEAPHQFSKFDNMGRNVAIGLFSSTASIVAASDSPLTETANRLALSQTHFDEMGRVWKTQQHKIDASDGSDDDDVVSLRWYDSRGRMIKTDGPNLTKTVYDRLGRTTHRFVLAEDNDSLYSHVDDVAGDIVMEESQTTYDPTEGTVIMRAQISRFHGDYGGGETTGALDTNADNDVLKYTAADLEGRIQISAMWHDRFDRVVDMVQYGTYGDATFDRDGLSVPARSDTALRRTHTYDKAGAQQTVEDPRGLFARTERDDAGNVTKQIQNYDAGVNSGNPDGTADNQTVVYTYTDGLQVTIKADMPSGQTDQTTTYTYGTTKGASAGDSKIATGHLLRKVTYPLPDPGTIDDVVEFAYNAQGELIWKEDQSGNIIEFGYDDDGAEEHRRITTLDGDFDGAVRRISTTYDGLGRAQLVTQYDNATVGSGSVVDEVKYTYDAWGPISKFEQDRNSTVGAGGSVDDYEVSYAFEEATAGRNTIRQTSITLPNGTVLNRLYGDASGLHDADISRVTGLRVTGLTLTQYEYLGASQVVATLYDEPDTMWKMYGGSPGSYPDLDRFNRVTSSRWTKDLSTDKDFYDVDIAYDRNSNITRVEDNVHAGFDVSYSIDDMDRLTRAEEGTWNGSSITSRKRDQQWTLDHVGNWDIGKLDLTGDGDFVDSEEYNDDRTHNVANELTARDTDDNGSDNFTLVYDEVGNLIDDGEKYEYVYDPFGRMRKIKDRSDDSEVAEFKYNGLGFRISAHEDTDDDDDVDGNDKWFHFAYDPNWRIVATFRESDTSPKEVFVNHHAGLDGKGRSSYIDLVAVRLKDANTAWTSASDGVLEERTYIGQNWRADVVAIVSNSGGMLEWAKYSAYGVPFGLPGGDTDSDGDCDATDVTQVQTWIDAPAYDLRGDIDLDGDVDATDKSTIQGSFQGTTLGWEALSDVGNRRGLAGYAMDQQGLYHVRHRVLQPALGRWARRDPLGYVDGPSLYEYVRSAGLRHSDPFGTVGNPQPPACLPGYGGMNPEVAPPFPGPLPYDPPPTNPPPGDDPPDVDPPPTTGGLGPWISEDPTGTFVGFGPHWGVGDWKFSIEIGFRKDRNPGDPWEPPFGD